jgi:DNA-binding response OmpR family regulator
MHILIVEDDVMVSKWTAKILAEAGYLVDTAEDGEEGLRLGAAGGYDLALIDVQLPIRSGISVVHGIRRSGQTMPIIIMTGRADDDDIVRGLDVGADDYLVKPVPNEVLKARVRAALRRGGSLRNEQLVVGDLVLDRLARVVAGRGVALELTPREFSLLEHFMLRPGEVVTRSDLLERVWGMRFDPGSNVIDATMNRLRGKLRDVVHSPLLRTVRGVGFVLATVDASA